jgi:hypothetical protein
VEIKSLMSIIPLNIDIMINSIVAGFFQLFGFYFLLLHGLSPLDKPLKICIKFNSSHVILRRFIATNVPEKTCGYREWKGLIVLG